MWSGGPGRQPEAGCESCGPSFPSACQGQVGGLEPRSSTAQRWKCPCNGLPRSSPALRMPCRRVGTPEDAASVCAAKGGLVMLNNLGGSSWDKSWDTLKPSVVFVPSLGRWAFPKERRRVMFPLKWSMVGSSQTLQFFPVPGCLAPPVFAPELCSCLFLSCSNYGAFRWKAAMRLLLPP